MKLRGHKRKLHEDDSSSNEEEDEEDDSTVKVTNNERSHALSPAPSNHSISGGEQILCSASPKSRRVEDRTSNADSTGTSVKDRFQYGRFAEATTTEEYDTMDRSASPSRTSKSTTVEHRATTGIRSSTTIICQQGERDTS